MLKRLRIKFVCSTMAIVTVMLCAVFATAYGYTAKSLAGSSLQTMKELAEAPIRVDSLSQWSQELRLPYLIAQVSSRGELLALGGYFDFSDQARLEDVLNLAYTAQSDTGVLSAYGLRYYRVPSGTGQRLVLADISGERSALRGLLSGCAVIGALSLGAFLLLSLLLARWAVKPVERAWEQQRQFVADASHELKTPLTVILTDAELLQAPGCGQEDRERFSAGILTMARQMRGLVESLLELARMDSAFQKPALEPLDLSALLEEALLPFEPLFFEQGLELNSRIEPGIRVNGDAARLRQVAEILLDNARKYAAPATAVELCLQRQGRSCRLSVASRGEALSAEDLKNIFKRFYRVDKTRGMNQGYGLGLSIAESAVQEHRGRIWAESRDGVNTFFVELPV